MLLKILFLIFSWQLVDVQLFTTLRSLHPCPPEFCNCSWAFVELLHGHFGCNCYKGCWQNYFYYYCNPISGSTDEIEMVMQNKIEYKCQ